MVLYVSKEPDVEAPEDLTIWEWLFESPEYSPLGRFPKDRLKAFVDADTKEKLDWTDVKLKSTALSTYWVSECGLRSGDTVSVFSGNSIWYPVCMLAALRAGARISGSSTGLTIDEIAYALRVAKAKIVVAASSVFAKVRKAALDVGVPPNKIFLLEKGDAQSQSVPHAVKSGVSTIPPKPYRLPPNSTNKHLCGFLNFSSGTTGLPKPVMLSHHNIIMECHIQRQLLPDVKSMTLFAVLPLYHVTGTWRFCLWPIFLNTDCIMLPNYSFQSMLAGIVAYQIEELSLAPPIVLRLARDPIVDNYDLRCVKTLVSGAAPTASEVLKSLERRLPWIKYRSGYGATEAPVITGAPRSHRGYGNTASVGTLLPNTVAKIVDAEGNELSDGKVGEILIKGPQVAMGYLDNIEATRATFDLDGFYHTGDLGHFDEEGLLYVSDRIKELIKVKGIQVAPAELEDFLLGHAAVADCAVIGQPNEYTGELPKAYVVLKTAILPSTAQGEALLQYVKDNKAKYKWLVEVEFIDKVPKSPAGKLLRKVLREADRAERLRMSETTFYVRIRDTERFGIRQ